PPRGSLAYLLNTVGAHAPTSARIAPGPSSVLPSSSLAAPTRIEILPRCLFSWSSWWASATPSKPITRQSTGWILPSAISWLARMPSWGLGVGEVRADDLLLAHPQVADVEVERVAGGRPADHHLAERLHHEHRGGEGRLANVVEDDVGAAR